MVGTEERDAGRALWLAERRQGIGGSDAAAVLGVGKYGSALEVWLDKTGRKPESPSTEPMWWGSALEDLIARRYMERTGRKVWKPDRTLVHPIHPEIIGTPDRLVIGQKRGLEIKTASIHVADEWGREGTDQIPHGYAIQCLLYMAITGFPVWDCIVLIGGNETRIYTLWRDEAFENMMVNRLVEWWRTYVVPDVKPLVDARSGHALEILYSDDERPELIESTPSTEIAAATLLDANDSLTTIEARRTEMQNILKDAIGEAAGIVGDGWKATWKRTKPRRAVDWERAATLVSDRLAEAIGPAEAHRTLAAAREQATGESPGSRVFRCTRTKE